MVHEIEIDFIIIQIDPMLDSTKPLKSSEHRHVHPQPTQHK